jgi:hypothetical protein
VETHQEYRHTASNPIVTMKMVVGVSSRCDGRLRTAVAKRPRYTQRTAASVLLEAKVARGGGTDPGDRTTASRDALAAGQDISFDCCPGW